MINQTILFLFLKLKTSIPVKKYLFTLQVLLQWITNHRKFINNPLYIAGDSYSGMIVPIVTVEVAEGSSPCQMFKLCRISYHWNCLYCFCLYHQAQLLLSDCVVGNRARHKPYLNLQVFPIHLCCLFISFLFILHSKTLELLKFDSGIHCW